MGKNKKQKKSNSSKRLNRNFKIQKKNFSIEDMEAKFKEKILEEKKICKKDIIKDTVGCILLEIIDVGLLWHLFNSKLNIVTIGTLLAFVLITYITARLAKPLPSRIYNYRHFNFERTYYATITNKYSNTYKDMYGNVNDSYCLDLQFYDNKKTIKKYVNSEKYKNLKVGGKVILANFDNYNTYVIGI